MVSYATPFEERGTGNLILTPVAKWFGGKLLLNLIVNENLNGDISMKGRFLMGQGNPHLYDNSRQETHHLGDLSQES